MDKIYIGDGVFLSYDGYQIKLEAESGGGLNVIYLDPHTYQCLIVTMKRLQPAEAHDE